MGYALLTLTECLDSESEAQKSHEHDVERIEAAEDAPKALEPAE